MRKLDFLSDFPKAYIFQKSSNKTTFGGFLTLVYIFIVFLIAIAYVYNYYANDKYIISYIYYESLETYDKKKELIKDPEYNPTLYFNFEIFDQKGESLNKNFIIVDMKKGTILERNEYYQYKVSELDIVVIYKCLDMNCDLQPEDKKYENQLFYYFRLIRQAFSLNLQDKNQPIQLDNTEYISFLKMNQNFMQSVKAFWEIIRVKEEKGLFDNYIGNKKEKVGGTFSDSFDFYNIQSRPVDMDMDNIYFPKLNLSGIYKPIFEFEIANDFSRTVEYIRNKISIFDVIANICSLSIAIFNGFRFGFDFFYSQNFDNYKIIDKILTAKGKSREKKINDAKFDRSFPLLNENELNEEEEKDVD